MRILALIVCIFLWLLVGIVALLISNYCKDRGAVDSLEGRMERKAKRDIEQLGNVLWVIFFLPLAIPVGAVVFMLLSCICVGIPYAILSALHFL